MGAGAPGVGAGDPGVGTVGLMGCEGTETGVTLVGLSVVDTGPGGAVPKPVVAGAVAASGPPPPPQAASAILAARAVSVAPDGTDVSAVAATAATSAMRVSVVSGLFSAGSMFWSVGSAVLPKIIVQPSSACARRLTSS